ncbi:protein sll1483-like [Daphnia pulex]|uniref:protein sll1483-like n=1 Tax=Daphnia pulex TaxID=6669 RepID=UPI001EDD95B2|nr:protein sll1483-like [Daphnia pulex]
MNSSLALAGLLLLVLVVSAKPQDASTNLRNTLMSANFTRLVEEMVKFDLADSVSKAGPKTIFAPSNQAFREMMMANRPMTNSTEAMMKLLRRSFVVSRRIMPSDITNEMVVDTISGEKLRFNIYNMVMTVNGAIMMKEPIVVKDDVIVYRLNSVILSSFTSGQNMMAVLEMNKDRFSTLIRCIQDTGLTDTLTKDGPFTLFAPTNEAFRSLPSEALARLMAAPAELKRVLSGHVTKGTYFLGALDSKDSGTDMVLPTLDGGSNKIMINGRSIKVDGTPVVTSADNIMAENGVIHAISRVLMPN